ncbi:hypothetical protein [Methylosinus sporium]|uniref:hypothetical protein n=1 Tax=Methylosinus sporium TaxID=428 RepID=UPI0011B23780|nr:hypothetical protein [Methylosinus sporium]
MVLTQARSRPGRIALNGEDGDRIAELDQFDDEAILEAYEIGEIDAALEACAATPPESMMTSSICCSD